MMYLLTLLYYYLGFFRVAFSLYYIAGFASIFRNRNIKIFEFFTLLFIFSYILVKYYQTGSFVASSLYIRLYWGFIFLYFLFKYLKLKNPKFFFITCALVTIFEYIAIRYDLSLTKTLLNYDGTFDRQVEFLGLIGGVHSFGGNRTVTGSLMLAAYIFFDNHKEFTRSKIKYLMLFSSIICFSGTAFILLVLYFLYKNYRNKYLPLLIIPFSFLVVYLQSIWTRISWKYIEVLYDYKAKQITDHIPFLIEDYLSLFFGTSKILSESEEVSSYGILIGDFSFFDFLLRNGLIGLVFIIFFVFKTINKKNFLPVIFILTSTLHYHVAFSFPGQVFLAYFLNIKDEEKINFDE